MFPRFKMQIRPNSNLTGFKTLSGFFRNNQQHPSKIYHSPIHPHSSSIKASKAWYCVPVK